LNAAALCHALRSSRGFLHKRDITEVLSVLQGADHAVAAVPIGDDCAAIPDGDGYLLFAIEGFVEDFVSASPWFAGYCGVMVNVSDIYAMGGRPLAVVDALWSRGPEPGAQILEGLKAAARRYRVPVVGGHSNYRADGAQLAVAILGRATRLLSSFAARPGDPHGFMRKDDQRLSRRLQAVGGGAIARRGRGTAGGALDGRRLPRAQLGGRVRGGSGRRGFGRGRKVTRLGMKIPGITAGRVAVTVSYVTSSPTFLGSGTADRAPNPLLASRQGRLREPDYPSCTQAQRRRDLFR
jgi:hypothetical protein